MVGARNTSCDIAVKRRRTRPPRSTRRAAAATTTRSSSSASRRTRSPIAFWPCVCRWPCAGLLSPRRCARRWASSRTSVGLQKPDHAFFETHPIVNQQLVYYVGHGDITPKPDIERFDAAGAVFTDRTRADVDLVVFATGYLAVFPFLADQDALDAAQGRPQLALQMASPKYQNLWLSGPIQPDSGQWTIAHWQAMAIAAFLDLQRRDPAAAQRLHDELNAERTRRFSGGSHYKGLDPALLRDRTPGLPRSARGLPRQDGRLQAVSA